MTRTVLPLAFHSATRVDHVVFVLDHAEKNALPRPSEEERGLVHRIRAGLGLIVSHFDVSLTNMNSRGYRMTARAEAAAATGERILAAAERLFSTRQYDQASLADIARAAGVTLQTVLRRFGSKERLFGTAAERVYARVAAQRGQTRPGDVPGAIRNLLDHYEEFGALAMHLLSQEGRVPLIAEATARGREFHAAWVERTLAPLTRGLPVQARRRRMATLVALTDVYVWKVLRQDRGLTRAATETALLETLRALTSGGA